MIQRHLVRPQPTAGGQRPDRVILCRLVVGLLGHQEHVVPGAQGAAGERPLGVDLLAEEARAEGGIGEMSHPLGQRQMRDLPVGGVLAERVEGQLQTEQHADRPAGDLGLHRQSGVDRVGQGREQQLPGVLAPCALRQREA